MEKTPVPPDPGFIVDWQIAEGAAVTIDLSSEDADLVLPEDEAAWR
jgi:hypothetical protein